MLFTINTGVVAYNGLSSCLHLQQQRCASEGQRLKVRVLRMQNNGETFLATMCWRQQSRIKG